MEAATESKKKTAVVIVEIRSNLPELVGTCFIIVRSVAIDEYMNATDAMSSNKKVQTESSNQTRGT